MKNNNKAFTIVELIVALIILIFCSAIVVGLIVAIHFIIKHW